MKLVSSCVFALILSTNNAVQSTFNIILQCMQAAILIPASGATLLLQRSFRHLTLQFNWFLARYTSLPDSHTHRLQPAPPLPPTSLPAQDAA